MNIKEIAKLAGVSASTVSKIINQKDDTISSETRERVLKIVKEYNYQPYATTLATQTKSWTIGVLLSSSVSLDTTLDGIIQTAQMSGYSILVLNNYSNPEQELKNITALKKRNVDGLIWEPVNEESLQHKVYLEKMEIPILTIGQSGGEKNAFPPYEEAAYQMTQELINQKHTKIACILTEGRRTAAFFEGYKKCLFDNQMPLDSGLIFYALDDNLTHSLKNRKITGIISSHYRKAMEFYQLMNSLTYQIPEDISLISLKNDRTEVSTFSDISDISTFTIKNADFGSALCKKLIDLIEKKETTATLDYQLLQLDNQTTISQPFNLNTPKVTVVGSIHIDNYLTVPKLPSNGKTVSISGSTIYPGGKGVNQSVGVAKLGHRVSLIGNIGTDLDADYIYSTLEEFGVETLGIKRCNNTNTGKAYIFVDALGHSMISILSGANGVFTPDDLLAKQELFKNTGYCLIQSEVPLATVAKACSLAHQSGAKTILKPSANEKIPQEILSEVDIFIPNEDELNELCPNHDSLEKQTDFLLECGIETIIVTLGERGCYVKTADWDEYVPAFDFQPLDTTGASDAFISALSSYLLYGYSLKKAVRIATYAAGFCITRDGVVPSLIDKQSLETYIKQKDNQLLQK